MNKQRVLVVGEDSLFSNGVKLLLVRQEKLEIIGTAPANMQAVITAIERLHPDVVIINDEIVTANAQLVMSLLKTHPNPPIITLNLEGNHINVYNSREVAVTNISDLVKAITSNTQLSNNAP